MGRALSSPDARMLNHVELIYGPGDRILTRRLFEALGCRVVDPRVDPIPENLGPAADPYLIIYLDSENPDVIDNVLYASEVRPEQWAFEEQLGERLERDDELARSHRALRESFSAVPQAMTHMGIAFPSAEDVERAIDQIRADRELSPRVETTPVFRPGGPGSVDDRIVQAFVYTDICSAGMLAIGQQIELQVRVDGLASS